MTLLNIKKVATRIFKQNLKRMIITKCDREMTQMGLRQHLDPVLKVMEKLKFSAEK